MKVVYIACPYTVGDVAVNVANCFAAADLLLKHGYIPYPPLYTHFWHIISPKPYEVWMEMDFEWIRRCDCVVRLPGQSSGADREVQYAASIGKPVFDSITELVVHDL